MATANKQAAKNAALRDAVFARYTDAVKARDVSRKFSVQTRAVQNLLATVEEELIGIEASGDLVLANRMKAEKEKTYSKTKNVYRLISKLADAKIRPGEGYTDWELREGIFDVMTGERTKVSAMFIYGITGAAYREYATYYCSNISDLL